MQCLYPPEHIKTTKANQTKYLGAMINWFFSYKKWLRDSSPNARARTTKANMTTIERRLQKRSSNYKLLCIPAHRLYIDATVSWIHTIRLSWVYSSIDEGSWERFLWSSRTILTQVEAIRRRLLVLCHDHRAGRSRWTSSARGWWCSTDRLFVARWRTYMCCAWIPKQHTPAAFYPNGATPRSPVPENRHRQRVIQTEHRSRPRGIEKRSCVFYGSHWWIRVEPGGRVQASDEIGPGRGRLRREFHGLQKQPIA
jgi:hypothetical protein